jgi:hypothetical protein
LAAKLVIVPGELRTDAAVNSIQVKLIPTGVDLD